MRPLETFALVHATRRFGGAGHGIVKVLMAALFWLAMLGGAMSTRAVAEPLQGFVFVTDYGTQSIWRVGLDGTGAGQIVSGLLNVRGIAASPQSGRIYYGENDFQTRLGTITSANADGTDRTTVLSGLPEGVGFMEVDSQNGKLYWSSTVIMRANLDGSEMEALSVPIDLLQGMAVDAQQGKIYWVNRGIAFFGSNGTIARANLNGSNAEILVTGLSDPSVVRLDVANGHMYWSEGYTAPNRIRRANLDGSNVVTVVEFPIYTCPTGFGLDLTSRKMYWAQECSSVVGRADLDGTNAETFLPGLYRPFAIALLHTTPVVVSLNVEGPTSPLPGGAPATIVATFADTGSSSPPDCSVEWNDPSNTSPVVGVVSKSGGDWICTASIVYTAAGVYEPRVTIDDDITGSTSSSYQYIVVYDADAGFVTGGGWIVSPPGAYTANALLTGKANFGFVSKYLRGATTPSGDTQFQFQTAAFNFKSTRYEWLVIAGSRAQYKGVGTVNGQGEYGFLLTAIDGDLTGAGGTDRLRMKIWNRTDDHVLYDNLLNDSEGAGQALAGGSISIKK